MDSIKDKLQETIPKKNIFSHVFDFEKTSQNDMLNIIQYVLIAIIPTVILNKVTQKLFPDVDEEKGNVEVLAELIAQVLFMILGFVIIHRLITYIPTVSKTDYAEVNILTIVIQFLALILSLQTKVGGKTNILLDRLYDYWEGKPKVQQQQQGMQSQGGQQPQQQQGGTGSLLPPPMVQTNSPMMNPPTQGPQQDFNRMYEGPTTPLINAATPGGGSVYESFEPMAANDGYGAFGGAGF